MMEKGRGVSNRQVVGCWDVDLDWCLDARYKVWDDVVVRDGAE